MEKRKHSRVKIILPTEVIPHNKSPLSSSEIVKGEVTDLSESGARLALTHLPEGFDLSFATLSINLSPCYSEDPNKASPVEFFSEMRWVKPTTRGKGRECGFRFIGIEREEGAVLDKIIRSEKEKIRALDALYSTEKPQMDIHREAHSCNMYSIDLTVGCEHSCIYCHFAEHNKSNWQKKYPHLKDFPVPVDLSPLYDMKKFPEEVIYLCPSSDPFAPKAKELTHELLSYLLPRGAIFTISTKAIVPDKTIELLKKYSRQIEAIAMGITNLDEERNRVLEPNCPNIRERLENLKKFTKIGCCVGARMDPIFPIIDDSEESLRRTVRAIYEAGAKVLAGTYIFSFGDLLKNMRREPFLKKSMKCLTERSYPMGGKALSVPVERKKRTYNLLNEICASYGIRFRTCGCKDTQLRDEGYPLICRNMDFYTDKQ